MRTAVAEQHSRSGVSQAEQVAEQDEDSGAFTADSGEV